MRLHALLQAALLLSATATPALARPNWTQISHSGLTFLDLNSIKGAGDIRYANVSMHKEDRSSTDTSRIAVNCKDWTYSLSFIFEQKLQTTKWDIIGKDTVAETAATIICPR